MYDMYPDWGPARNNPESRYSHEAQQRAHEQWDSQRDAADERPDDN